ncbi:uncharacterized protein LOC117173487 [Belonocnema kinseyi]|uniref:uncharacterized protein LOC117173487 n=1 Tax=Belonocnema kinseyi TaxID=2817044 RepID=UPI00143D37E5|nr:uncharacterized protein LOC117173487 [Belonocnema kinseyi]
MKIHVGAPLFTLAFFFSFIELSSLYNTNRLIKDVLQLPDDKHIWYNTFNGIIKIENGKNEYTYGLRDGTTMVCELDLLQQETWVRALMIDNQPVKVDARNSNVYNFTKDDTNLYGIVFDLELH